MGLLRHLRESWQTFVVILTPIILSPMLFLGQDFPQEFKCAYMLILVSVFWITESLPLPVTGLLPVALSPLLGLLSSKDACKVFWGDLAFLLLGGIFVSIAIEETNLHRRFALKILLTIGVQPRRLMFGFMVTTAFLSMWCSNTATTAMMITIARALMIKLFQTKKAVNLIEKKSKHYHQEMPVLLDTSVEINKELEQETQLQKDPTSERCLPESATASNTVKQIVSDCQSDSGIISEEDDDSEIIPEEVDDESVLKNLDPESLRVLKTFSMCICYSANVGGIATLTGTPTNLILARVVADLSGEQPITFANWMAFGFPITVLTLILCYGWMNIVSFGFWNTLTCKAQASAEEVARMRALIIKEYRSLGKIKFAEIVVLVHFFFLVGLWLTRHPGSVPGWSVLFPKGYITDGVAAIVVVVSLFIFPSERPNVLFFRKKGDTSKPKSMSSILNWKAASKKFQWGTIFLLGGGFVLADAAKKSGLSKVIANNLSFLKTMPVWGASMTAAAMTSLATEVTSNTVVTVLILPILADVAIAAGVNPLYLMLPTTAAASLAFMLPVATPPNALVFAHGDVKVIDMVKCGAILNILGISVVCLATNTWGRAVFSLDTFPDWLSQLPVQTINYTVTQNFGNMSGINITSLP